MFVLGLLSGYEGRSFASRKLPSSSFHRTPSDGVSIRPIHKQAYPRSDPSRPSLRWRREIASLCLLHQLLQERPDPLSDTLPQYASTCNVRSPRKPKELILANARTTRFTKSFFFRTSVVWNTLPGHLQQLTSPHQFKLAIREHFHAHKFNCLHNFSLTP